MQLELDKDTTHLNQLQTIFHYLKEHVATASMVTDATGVPQKCITRYKRDLEKAEMLWEIEKRDCQKTGFKAWYLSTDPQKAPKRHAQLSLFDSPTKSLSL
ncbi:MAG TPA: hypothetical protein DCR40_04250 [Prolixibacteraceae bacterium]|nr:hypothetical protein [Prolixibacteraceae bacterium]